MIRRDFLAGVAALPITAMPFAGQFRRRRRFKTALETVMNEKIRAGEIAIPVTALKQRVARDGKVATAGDHVYDDVQPPWFMVAWERLVAWIRENWDEILSVLMSLLPLLILGTNDDSF